MLDGPLVVFVLFALCTTASRFGWGTIQAGKVVDLVLLDADPLADIECTRKISAVILSGKFFARDDLDQMLAEARTAAGQVK